MKYCFDTSALIEPWVRLYPQEVFPSVWEKLKELADAGVIRAPTEVRIELERQSDGLTDWAGASRDLFLDLDRAQLVRVKEIVNKYPQLVKPNSTKSQADPFVITLADTVKVPVVTYEGRAKIGAAPKIPNVCDDLGIKYLSVVDVLRAEGFKL